MARIYQSTNINQWLGGPRTAQYVAPVTAGYAYGINQQDPALPSGGKARLGGMQLFPAASLIFGAVVLLPDSAVVAGEWTQVGTVYTNDTANAQSGTSDAMVTVSATTNNGFVVGAKVPFNILSVDVSTAAGAAGVAEYAYWGQPTSGVVGTAAFQAVATNLIVPATRFANATGENLVVLNIPPDLMTKTSTAAEIGTNSPVGYYFVRIRYTTASTTSIKIARIYAGVEIIRTAVAQATVLNLAGGTGLAPRATPESGIAVGSFWNTATAGNHFYLEYE